MQPEVTTTSTTATITINEPPQVTPRLLPRENLIRAVFPGVELRTTVEDDDGIGLMSGHFSVFDQWTEIDSIFEGRFMERIAPGAFRKTFKENRDGIRALAQHGKDPQIGYKPLGPVRTLEEDDTGAHYEVPLMDTSYNRDLLPGLKAGLYGASFKFRVVQEDVNKSPERSSYNPEGITERTVREAQVFEFGPVTFPAYDGATAGVRSLTDEYLLGSFLQADRERLAQLLDYLSTRETPQPEVEADDDPALAVSRAGEPDHSARVSRTPTAPTDKGAPLYGTRKDRPAWLL